MTAESQEQPEMLGALLGNYRVLGKLGEGGMGVVYVGRHEALGHSVVVKVLQPELSRNTEMVQRFFNEAQAAAAIRNLGIVQVFDFGKTSDGRAYFVMELLDGQSLAARLKQRRRLDAVECCRIGRQIAKVLQAAHARGITHRDLKPENLFLVPDDEAMGGERVKVLDFGIAKLAGEGRASGVRTRTGLVMGTPLYMSPEQCRGAGAVDARSDIYSLGCILFEMMCGRPPFIGEGDGEVLGAHQYVAAPHPQSFAPDMPPQLAGLIANMLAKPADARPQSMSVVSEALDEILQALGAPRRAPTPLPVPSPPQQPQPQQRSAATVPLAQTAAVSPPFAPPPRPAAQPSDSHSTTLGGSAGVSNARAGAPARRMPLVLGGLVVAGAVAVVVAVIAMRDKSSPEQQVSDGAIALQSIAAGTPDATVVVVAPPVTPDAAELQTPPIDVSNGPLPPPSSAEVECLRHQSDQKWGELEACAERLKATNPTLAKELKTRADLETKAIPLITAFETAMKDKNLKKAKAELEMLTNVNAYQTLKKRYEQAENQAIEDLVARLERVKVSGCKEYTQIVNQEKSSRPPRVAAEAIRRVKCMSTATQPPPPSQCNHEELADKANALYAAGRLVAAIESYEAAWRCKQDPIYAEKSFIIACNIPSIAKTKLLWKRMSAPMRQRALMICVRNGITEDMLNDQ